MLAVMPTPVPRGEERVIRRIFDLYELAMVSGAAVDTRAPRTKQTEVALDAVEGWVTEPDAFFHPGTASRYGWALLLDEFKLPARLRVARGGAQSQHQDGVIRRLAGRRAMKRWMEGLALGVIAGLIVWLVTR
jgi:hypothetical protein